MNNYDEILEKHSRVWNWIADYLEKYDLDVKRESLILVCRLKTEAVLALYPEDEDFLSHFNHCYLCYMTMQHCDSCPAGYDTNDGCMNGLYETFALAFSCMQDPKLTKPVRNRCRSFAISIAKDIAKVGQGDQNG